MDFDRLPSKPIMKNAKAAESEWQHWLRENSFQILIDGDGVDWNLSLEISQLPNDSDIHGAKWIAAYQLQTSLTSSELLRTGTLIPDRDERLIEMIGDKKIPMKMKKQFIEARGDKEAKDMMIRLLPDLRDSLAKMSLHETKRAIIAQWIEETRLFGSKMR